MVAWIAPLISAVGGLLSSAATSDSGGGQPALPPPPELPRYGPPPLPQFTQPVGAAPGVVAPPVASNPAAIAQAMAAAPAPAPALPAASSGPPEGGALSKGLGGLKDFGARLDNPFSQAMFGLAGEALRPPSPVPRDYGTAMGSGWEAYHKRKAMRQARKFPGEEDPNVPGSIPKQPSDMGPAGGYAGPMIGAPGGGELPGTLNLPGWDPEQWRTPPIFGGGQPFGSGGGYIGPRF